MSNSYFNEIWHLAQLDCDVLAGVDYERQNQDVEATVSALAIAASITSGATIDKRVLLQSSTYEFYLRYICIANKLEEVYDKMIQPQKRLLVRKLLDACLGRVIELKHDLVNIDLMEFSYNDTVIERLQLTPMDTELHIPRYFLRERRHEIEFRNKAMNDILIKLGWMEEYPTEERLTEIEAIRLIQVHERGRQGRLRAHFMKEIRMLKDKGKTTEEKGKGGTDSGLLAAMKIQKMWRGHTARQKTRRRKLEEMILIGMVPPPVQVQKKAAEKMEKLNEVIR